MTYTINGKEWGIYGINKRCAEILAWDSEHNVKSVEFEANCFWVEHVGFSAFPVQNYCNNPSDTDAIIDKCWDELMVVHITDDYYARWECITNEHNCTKLVAACICLIELNE
mgnify:CR=1 FL=1|tara:strand:- start:4703 stop:5038 length:336 start_codon:yes stop_codon:yes gene_type:complete